MALKDKLTSIATTVGGRANNAIENGKLNLKINGEERKIAEYTLHIGELLVEKLDAGETFDDEIAALYASNYDLTHVFIDSLCKIIPSEPDSPEVEEFLAWLSKFAEKNNIKFTITISADVALATDTMKTYF